jgi:hypothetical protein
MAKDTAQRTSSKRSGSNLDVQPQDEGVNPSAPTTGTEGWGTTSDERRVLSRNHPSHTRAGQMKGNPGDNQTEASQRASDIATTNKSSDDDSRR